MSNSIEMNSLNLKPSSAPVISAVHSSKDTGFHLSGTGAQNPNNTVDTVLNISKEARLKLKNQPGNANTFKKAGVTSARDQFEIDALDTRNYMRRKGRRNYHEWMRQDEPETYAKCRALLNKAAESGAKYYGDDGFEYTMERHRLEFDWYHRRCLDENGEPKNPVAGGMSVIHSLETMYSDSIHDTSVDVYNDSFSEYDQSPFRLGTKFNVLMPVDMLKDLEMLKNHDALSEKEKEEARDRQQKIDTAVNNMKEIEKNYEGNLQSLRFAVKFDHSGNATYYADYAFCESEYGISADTAEELLEKLMSENVAKEAAVNTR